MLCLYVWLVTMRPLQYFMKDASFIKLFVKFFNSALFFMSYVMNNSQRACIRPQRVNYTLFRSKGTPFFQGVLSGRCINLETLLLTLTFELPTLTPAQYFAYFFVFFLLYLVVKFVFGIVFLFRLAFQSIYSASKVGSPNPKLLYCNFDLFASYFIFVKCVKTL